MLVLGHYQVQDIGHQTKTLETLAIIMLVLAGLAAGYLLTSLLLLKHPRLLHGQRESRFPRCVHICHRGGANEGYENTLRAFDNAAAHGAHMLELDVHRSKDGVAVVIHDGDLRRLCHDAREVRHIDFAELPRINAKVPAAYPGDTFQDASLSPEDRKFASLESVFLRFPRMAINIDVKVFDKDLVNTVDALIRKYDREDRTVWGSFRSETNKLCYETNPRVGLYFSLKGVLLLLVLFYTGLLPFLPIRETHLEIPLISAMRRPHHSRTRCAVIYLLDKILMRRSLFRHLAQRGIPTYAWVVNTEEDFDRAFRHGVAGVMTDYPSRLQKYLEEHPQPVQ